MQVPLGEGDGDARCGQGLVDGQIQVAADHHVVGEIGPDPELEIEGTLAKTHEQDYRAQIGEYLGVFKLSLGNGLLYLYFREGSPFNTRWYFTALDVATGETVYKQLVGTGLGYNNWAASIFLHPDGGIAYSTTLFGLVMMQDTAP